jgi:hypothetical protein
LVGRRHVPGSGKRLRVGSVTLYQKLSEDRANIMRNRATFPLQTGETQNCCVLVRVLQDKGIAGI